MPTNKEIKTKFTLLEFYRYNNDYTVCIKQQTQTASFCIRSCCAFSRFRLNVFTSMIHILSCGLTLPVYSDCIYPAKDRNVGKRIFDLKTKPKIVTGNLRVYIACQNLGYFRSRVFRDAFPLSLVSKD